MGIKQGCSKSNVKNMNCFNMLHGLWDTQIPLGKWGLNKLMWVQNQCSVNISNHGGYYCLTRVFTSSWCVHGHRLEFCSSRAL